MKTPQRLHILSNFQAITPICPVTTALKRREIVGAEGREWQKNFLPWHSFSQVTVKCSHFTKEHYTRVKLLFCFLNLLCFRHFHYYSGIVSQDPLWHQWEREKLLDCRHVCIIKDKIVQGCKQVATLNLFPFFQSRLRPSIKSSTYTSDPPYSSHRQTSNLYSSAVCVFTIFQLCYL